MSDFEHDPSNHGPAPLDAKQDAASRFAMAILISAFVGLMVLVVVVEALRPH